MKAVGYMPLHYGKDYLKYSLLSVYEALEHIYILYAPRPSHGTITSLQCPDSEQELIEICADVDKDNKITWHRGHWQRENEQRNYAHYLATKDRADILVSIDFDEVWNTEMLKELIKETYDKQASKCLVWMRHLWRSFDYICDDMMRQERIYYLKNGAKDLIYSNYPTNQVWHFGYARKIEDVKYKISIHGHKKEWLNKNWIEKKYAVFPPTNDVHPTCENTWEPRIFDKRELPLIMREHPYFNLECIS